jgi:hypothetical protein
MKNIRFRIGHVQSHVFPFPDTPLARGLAGVAIGAEDLALRNLIENGGPRET